MSEQISDLVAALAEFHAEFEDVAKKGKNPFYKSSYVTKADLVSATRALLAKQGLVVVQRLEGNNRIITTIFHKSGQWLQVGDFEFPRPKEDPHAIASAITYFSRHQLMAALYIGGTDDDGNEAFNASKVK